MDTTDTIGLLARGYTREQIAALAAAREAQAAADEAAAQAAADEAAAQADVQTKAVKPSRARRDT